MTDAVDPPAERLLHDLGITEPGEIDVEVIACAVGATVRYRRLGVGDARIVGLGDRAIITVDDRASRVRQRFSVAHELGHWHHHRGQQLICHGAAARQDGAAGCERQADGYAADLLMPRFMLEPLVAGVSMSFDLVYQVAAAFGVSAMAAALRLADVHPAAFALVVEEADGRRWFRRSASLNPRWFVRSTVSDMSAMADHRRLPHPNFAFAVPAQQWFLGQGIKDAQALYAIDQMACGTAIHLILVA
ncbi:MULTISPECIES: ImmA/IrrE family metallo-endopeptidase [unclassified Sphingomonas]|uniref:ImmA/IrrE family metallo-endopeptidase n=1 Tax=unclassified Sphingomonas TaxID=196159 RepID=UPI00285CC037|nr:MULTISPECIES: ImmA/IrrE family metallo-endopeptidase [unclassified Sphingomonas]MDR6113170.1 Zn-dependent peptidase ImmA (M78 family) [Sphingomonas sp. SORGH_AS_0789]MDR6149469.1 Zn-dependent peptidase ImmA (M78 family) [Sphingomonas sp. SORGH_AS_0742]